MVPDVAALTTEKASSPVSSLFEMVTDDAFATPFSKRFRLVAKGILPSAVDAEVHFGPVVQVVVLVPRPLATVHEARRPRRADEHRVGGVPARGAVVQALPAVELVPVERAEVLARRADEAAVDRRLPA